MSDATARAPGPARSGRLRAVLLGLSAVLAVLGAVLYATARDPEPPPRGDDAGAALSVLALRVERRPLPRETIESGLLEARRRLELIAETSGRVVELGADELDRVEEGQRILAVDPTLAEVAVERAEAAVARAESRYALAQTDYERWTTLAERDAGSVSRRDDATTSERVAWADLREARASLREARDALAKKVIVAPFAGVLRALPVEVGEVLQPGKRVGELLDLATARLVVGLADREIVATAPGQEARVSVEALPGRTFPGVVRRVGAAADPDTKKFPVEIELENPEGLLLPGMVATARLSLGAPRPTTVVPRDASFEDRGLRYVFVLAEGEGGTLRAERRRVEVRELPFRPTELEVVGGLEPGERIAVSRVRELRDGARVRISGGDAGASDEERT